MNERIESYLKQHHCRDYFNAYGDAVEDEHYFMYREEVDGLIELIVRECIRVPYNMWDKAELNADVAVKIEHRIKEHFGVEE